jgi:hypothetical protein
LARAGPLAAQSQDHQRKHQVVQKQGFVDIG